MKWFTGFLTLLILASATALSHSSITITPPGGTITFQTPCVASGDPHTLDCYEEGTWQPSVGGSATYLIQSGFYTKIGRVVFISFLMQINVIGTGSTSTISGLPFSVISGNAVGEHTCSVLFTGSAINETHMVFHPNQSSTNGTLFSIAAAGASMTNQAVLTSGTLISSSCMYMAGS